MASPVWPCLPMIFVVIKVQEVSYPDLGTPISQTVHGSLIQKS